MILRVFTAAVLVAGLLACPYPTGAAEPKPGPKSGPTDVLCLTEDRPVAVGFDITVHGKPVTESWERFADALFADSDTDKNGTIEGEELVRLPQTLLLLTMRLRLPPPEQQAMTPAALRDYLRKNDFGPLRLSVPFDIIQPGRRIVRTGMQGETGALDKALMDLLDTDKDGKLSKAELAAAPAVLATLDADENELIGAEEILKRPALPSFSVENNDPAASAARFEMFRLDRKGSDPALAKRLIDRYRPKPKAGTAPMRWLTRADLKIPDSLFTALDQDDNDELDATELARFGTACTPEVALAVQLGKRPTGKLPVAVVATGKAPVVASAPGAGTSAAVTLPGLRLDVVPGGWSDFGGLRAAYLELFRTLDSDANGYLDETEVRRNGIFRSLFSRVDANGDGKVFEKELVAAFDELEALAAEAAGSLVVADVIEAGRGLFGLIDTNGDGQLSIRELRAMAHLLERADGAFRPGDIPRRFQMTLVSGLGASILQLRRPDGGLMVLRQAVGPLWFQKMDRNRDGDVSRREFLGTDEAFRRLDLDGDGLIDAREAEAAGKLPPR